MRAEHFFDDDGVDPYTGPSLTDDLVAAAETALDVRLPAGYVALLRRRNGGTPRRGCFRTQFRTAWGGNFVEVRALLGVGGEYGIDSATFGSAAMISEWGYPPIGLVVWETASAGHDAVMLDYRDCGPADEPTVAYVGEDRVPRLIASSFDEFVERLESCDEVIADLNT